jgi:hypothetical protein
MALNKRFKKRWLKALRSGDYKQARNSLHNEVGFCCLGVATDICDPGCWSKRPVQSASSVGPKEFLYREHRVMLIPTLLREQGLNLTEAKYLAKMNDGTAGLKAHSFEEIADYIEENL